MAMKIKHCVLRCWFGFALLALAADAGAQDLVRVDGHAVTLTQLLVTAPGAARNDQLKQRALQGLVRQQLLADSAGMPLESLQQQIDAGQADVRRRLLAQFATERYLAAHPVPDAEIARVQARVQAAAPKEQYWVRSIVVADPALAAALLERLRHGASFARLAIEHSQADNEAFGGALGWRNALTLPAPYVATLRELKVGQIAGPIAVDRGFAIIELLGKRKAPAPDTASLREAIAQRLSAAEIDAYVAELQKKARIEWLTSVDGAGR
jgi:parvulin-like peptidyl-prolyl isomerase